MLFHATCPSIEVDKRNSVYIPVGAEKGDCPFCKRGVLRRDTEVEKYYDLKEAYICNKCAMIFSEFYRTRLFKGVAKNRGLL